MLLAQVLTLFLVIISSSIANFQYNSTIMSESLMLFTNHLFFLEISKLGEDDTVNLIINRQILDTDNLRFNIEAIRFDHVEFPIPGNPVLLCQLLEEEITNQNSTLSELRFSRVFGMEGMRCPISAGKRRLMPYMFPSRILLHNDIGCGKFIYKTTIETCEEELQNKCMPMISADTTVDLQTTECTNFLM